MSTVRTFGCAALIAAVLTPAPAFAGTGTAEFYALTTAGGSLARGSGVISSAKTSLGNYKIVFARTLNNCVWIVNNRAGVGLTNSSSFPGQPEALIVQTFSPGGAPTDRAINIIVRCQD